MARLIKNVRLAVEDGLKRADILVIGERIEAVGDLDDIRLPELETVNADGLTALPGLIDGHVHVCGGGGEDGFASRVRELRLEDFTENGVTTVIGLLGTDAITRSPENVLAKVKGLEAEGISAWCLTGAYAYPTPTITGSVEKDVCFIDKVLGVKLAISDHRCSHITVEELRRLATQIRFAALISGKVGVLHMHTGRGKAGLRDVFAVLEQSDIPISHFRPTHCANVQEDAIRFGKMGGWIDYTTGKTERTVKAIMEAAEAGLWERITFSSDSGGSMPIWNEKKECIGMGVGTPDTLLETISALVKDAGLPLGKAAQLLTSHPADALGLKQKGRIRPGADADILLLDDTMKIVDVYARGRLMVHEGKAVVRSYYI